MQPYPIMQRQISALLVGLVFATLSNVWAQDHYAVLIGVEKYDTSTFRNLEFAGDDAIALSTQFQQLGFKTTVMTGESDSAKLQPTTPDKILATITAIGRSCEEEDTFVIALSGHGVQFGDEDYLPSGVRESYFCPSDADLNNKSSLLKISTVVEVMNATKANKKLLLIDACQEQVLSTEGQKKGRKLIDLGSVHETRKTTPGGIAILFSCSNKQFSWEHRPLGHSVFSYHLIEYLKGAAESRYYDEGKLDLSGLVSYVTKSTNDYIIEKNLTPDGQYPVLQGNTNNWRIGNKRVVRKKNKHINSLEMEFVYIPQGSFLMGSAVDNKRHKHDENQHKVTISRSFYLGAHEVTQLQYEKIMKTNFSYRQDKSKKTDTSRLPVERVSWDDAVAFCTRLSEHPDEVNANRRYRLPTEAEWEYACRAGTTTTFNWGDNENLRDEFAWTNSNARYHTHNVGLKKPNRWGLFDMHGNVFEWCADWYDVDYGDKPLIDPKGPSIGTERVLRGGCWDVLETSAGRWKNETTYRNGFVGFRVVLIENKPKNSGAANKSQ
jgi:formylglycine-generating enzyme required for sulfatase activity